MKRHVFWAFIAALLLTIAPQQARAACDYDIGGSPPYTFSEFEVDMDEELACIGAILGGLDIGSDVQAWDADLDLLAAGALTDPGMDLLAWWDDSQGRFEYMTLADMAAEASPATGDYVVLMGAEGDVRKVDWSNLPGAGAGLSATDIDTSSEIAAIVGDETGSGALVFANSPTLVTPALGTPSSATLTNASGLPLTTGIADNAGCTGGQLVRRNAGDTAWECVTASSGGGMTLLDTITTTSGTTNSVTGLTPASCRKYFIEAVGVSFTASAALTVAISGNNGSNYGTAVTISPASGSGGAELNGWFEIGGINIANRYGATIGSGAIQASTPTASIALSGLTLGKAITGATGAVDAIQVAGGTFDAGSMPVYCAP